MYSSISKGAITLLLGLIAFVGKAQVFPTDVTTTINPPYGVWYADYFAPGDNKFMVNINFKDFNEPAFDARLKIKITGPNITLETKPNFIPPQPITLIPGVPTILSGSDLADYFAFNAWNYTGTTQSAFQSQGKFTEGTYEFCVEVLDYLTGKEISRQSCYTAWIQLKDQPLVIGPNCGDPVLPGAATNIVFQWQNSGSLSANSAMSTEYQLELFEITVPGVDPMAAIPNNQVLSIFQSSFQSGTSYIYGPSDPALDLGTTYIWRVQAKDQNGFDSFKNNGFTEVCWFSYGYPEGGSIALNKPEDEEYFTKDDLPYFKWATPNNLLASQQVEYTLKVAELNEGQDPEDAIANNTAWLEETTTPTSAPNGFEYLAQDSIPKAKDFAWQVIAKTGEQTVAESPVQTFTGPPLVEEFKAGAHTVLLSRLDNNDLSDLDGAGYIQIGDSVEVEVEFEGLDLSLISGSYVLNDGEIEYDVASMSNIAVVAQHDDVPNGVFKPEIIKLNKTELQIKGIIELPLPLAVNGGDQPKFKTQSQWLNFDDYTLAGTAKSDETNNDYSLLDPYGFNILYNETSDLIINDNEFILDLKGTITLPQAVKSPDGNAVAFEFSEQDNFNYGTINAISGSDYKVMDGSLLYHKPTKAVLDFSSDKSPGVYSGDDAWTGLYFVEGSLIFPQAIDESGQITLPAEMVFDAELSQPYMIQTAIDGAGIQFEAAFDQTQEIYAAINGYRGLVNDLDLKVEDGATTAGEYKIDAVLPFINSEKLFEVVVPFETDHYDKAFFPQEIKETIVFDEDDDQRKTEVSVENVSFDDQGVLDMTVDISNTYTELSLTKLQHFKVDASGEVGFNAVGQSMALETTAKATLGGIPLDVDSIAFGKISGNYGVAMGASMNLGVAASGEDGELRTSLVSALNYVAPEASVGAVADVAASFDATTGSASVSGNIGGSASGSLGGAASGSASAGASGGASIGPNGASIGASAGAGASFEPGLLNDLAKGVNMFTGGIMKDDHNFEINVGAGAGASAGVTENGFKATCHAHLDIVIASASGHLLYEVDDRWGAIMRGGASLSGSFIKIKYIEDIDGELALGVKDGKPLALMRAQATTAVPIFPPKIGLTHIGFAAGLHFAPETFTPDEFTPVASMDFDVDMSTPLFAYVSAGISDFVPSVEGIVYQVSASGGLRAKGEIDIENPASLADIELCGAISATGGIFNIASGFLANIVADKSVVKVDATGELCVGKIFTNKAYGTAQMMITPIIPLCAEANVYYEERYNFGAVTDPLKFLDDFLFEVRIGSEQNPLSVQPFCDPSLKLVKGWFGFKYTNNTLDVDMGAGIDIDKSVQFPNIPIGFTGDYIAPYFGFKAILVGKSHVTVGLGSLKNPAPQAAFSLQVNAQLFATAGVKYQILTQSGDLNLGTLNVRVQGIFDVSTTNGLLLDGEFEAKVSVLGVGYEVKHVGSIEVPI